MRVLLDSIEKLQNSKISVIVEQRIEEFSKMKKLGEDHIFKELCFCIMTANCGAEKCIEVHEKVGNNFLRSDEINLSNYFKEYGYRFPNVRASYIVESRKKKSEIWRKLNDNLELNELRDWIVKNIKGLGYKETSHFLRNIGYKYYAIVDFHIIDLLVKHSLIEEPKTLTKKKYLEIENVLKDLANRLNLTLAELDLYLWYLETGKVLK